METREQKILLAAFEQNADALFRHGYWRLYDTEAAKDLVQEAFCRAWSYLAEGKEIKNPRAFLYRTLNNLIVDETRKRHPASLDQLAEEGFTPAERTPTNMEDRLMGGEVMKKLGTLDEMHRTILLMHYVDELSTREIASALDVSANVVYVRLHRGIKKLQVLMKQDDV